MADGPEERLEERWSRLDLADPPVEFFRGDQWPGLLELRITLPQMLLDEMKPEEARRRVHRTDLFCSRPN